VVERNAVGFEIICGKLVTTLANMVSETKDAANDDSYIDLKEGGLFLVQGFLDEWIVKNVSIVIPVDPPLNITGERQRPVSIRMNGSPQTFNCPRIYHFRKKLNIRIKLVRDDFVRLAPHL
jgi:hypothetical protein